MGCWSSRHLLKNRRDEERREKTRASFRGSLRRPQPPAAAREAAAPRVLQNYRPKQPETPGEPDLRQQILAENVVKAHQAAEQTMRSAAARHEVREEERLQDASQAHARLIAMLDEKAAREEERVRVRHEQINAREAVAAVRLEQAKLNAALHRDKTSGLESAKDERMSARRAEQASCTTNHA